MTKSETVDERRSAIVQIVGAYSDGVGAAVIKRQLGFVMGRVPDIHGDLKKLCEAGKLVRTRTFGHPNGEYLYSTPRAAMDDSGPTTRRTIDVHVLVEATFYGVELDIPSRYKTKEEIDEWVKAHKREVDFAKPTHTETNSVREVLGATL